MSGKRSKAERKSRMQDLFVQGRVLRLGDEDDDIVFVQKLNQFEQDEARRMSQAARTRVQMALRKEDGDEMVAVRGAVGDMDKPRMIEGIIASLYGRHIGKASAQVQADAEWQERLDVMDHSVRDLLPEDERKVLDEITSDYLAELNARREKLDDEERARLDALDEDALRAEYISIFIETRGQAVFMREMRYAEVLFGVRLCDAEQPDEDADWDHSACTHEPFYDDIEEVRALPDILMNRYTETFDKINVAPSQGKDSRSPQASSGLSASPSEEEASTPSTQEVTSPEPVGTSA